MSSQLSGQDLFDPNVFIGMWKNLYADHEQMPLFVRSFVNGMLAEEGIDNVLKASGIQIMLVIAALRGTSHEQEADVLFSALREILTQGGGN